MITQGFEFLAVIFGLCGILVWLEARYRSAFFRWFPSIVLVMFASMALYTVGLWQLTEQVREARESLRDKVVAVSVAIYLPSTSFTSIVFIS